MMIQDNALAKYMKDISIYPLIDVEKEQELTNIVRTSQDETEIKKAKDLMLLSNLRIVVKCAIKIYRSLSYAQDSNMSIMDLVQAGNMGLAHAVDLYDPTRTNKFSNYAFESVIRWIKRAVKESRFIRLPPTYAALIYKVDKLQTQNGGYLTDKEIAEKLDINIKTVPFLRRNKEAKLSLDFLRDENVPIESLIERDCRKDPTEVISNTQELKDYLYEKIKELKPRDRDIMYELFFCNKEQSMKDVGVKFNITRERVRQIVEKCLKKLKKKVRQEGIFQTEEEEKEEKNEKNRNRSEDVQSHIFDWIFEGKDKIELL